jgi:aspartate/methionine/tyrosine aminotransferase
VPGRTSRTIDDQASLTADERYAQDSSWNLADAHARQRMSPDEKKSILEKFPEIFWEAHDHPYSTLERNSAITFLNSLGQYPKKSVAIAAYSSSLCTMIVSRLLRRNDWDVSLTWPTFDNLPALLTAEGVVVRPRQITSGPVDAALSEDWPKCVFEVSPNNPTGDIISRDELTRLADVCADNRRLLVLDQSFKGHVREACFDHYEVLEASGVDYIVIEDTGKLWPLLDMKVAFLVTNEQMARELRPVVDDILLNVSPFHLALVRRYAEYSREDGRDYDSIRDVIEINRRTLRDKITAVPDLLTLAYPNSRVGVEVLNVAPADYPCFMAALEERKVAVLPTDKFYWGADRKPRTSQIRIALCRDQENMSTALGMFMEAAHEACEKRSHGG